MSAIGRDFIATLSTSERGPVLTRKAATRQEAFAQARLLLDQAERRDWNRGEAVLVKIERAEE